MKNPWTILGEKTIYDNKWINVTEYDVLNPSGGKGIYGTVRFKNLAIGILPLDEEGYTWLVGQYRFPLNAYSWEIPEGGGDPEVAPVASAQRELIEETGLVAKDWTMIQEMHLSNSVTDEQAFIFLARGLERFLDALELETRFFGRIAPSDHLFLMVHLDGMRQTHDIAVEREATHRAISLADAANGQPVSTLSRIFVETSPLK